MDGTDTRFRGVDNGHINIFVGIRLLDQAYRVPRSTLRASCLAFSAGNGRTEYQQLSARRTLLYARVFFVRYLGKLLYHLDRLQEFDIVSVKICRLNIDNISKAIRYTYHPRLLVDRVDISLCEE
jgi:hypothetical protein